ncbi:MAG TPA: diacylglycerol kinase [Thiopseudomonas sp.]|nr:diacylglycerol kinase [Thiopseudomonas sp.]
MKPGAKGIRRLIHAGRYSWQGLKAAWKSEAAIRQEVLALVVLLPIALLVPVSAAEKALLTFSAILLLVVELINSAIEAVVDRLGTEYHELSGKAKDIGSAAVLVTLLAAVIVWVIILLPLLRQYLN